MATSTTQTIKEKIKAATSAGPARTTKADKSKTKASAAQKEQARKARTGARIAKEGTKTAKTKKKVESAPIATTNTSELVGIGGVSFRAADFITGDIWTPNPAIPAIDEATHEAQLTQAQGQGRSIAVAAQNLKNIQGLHGLEGQSVDIAIAAKANDTRYAKLEGADIDYQSQIQANGEKTQKLAQATAKHQSATRETGYTNELISMKDENFQLEIQQARMTLNEKTARFKAMLTS